MKITDKDRLELILSVSDNASSDAFYELTKALGVQNLSIENLDSAILARREKAVETALHDLQTGLAQALSILPSITGASLSDKSESMLRATLGELREAEVKIIDVLETRKK